MPATQGSILIVDDIAANRLVLERMVASRGHQVVMAENGHAAIELMHSHSFDMVLLDIMMPLMNGYEVLARLREDPELRHVPVVVVSALNDVESVARCVALGAIDYLFKPIDRTLLGARIDACLERKRLRDREQEAYAAARAANQAKSEFIALVSHELKSPLTAIRGYADLLQLGTYGPVADAQAGHLAAISDLAGHMGALLADLSDLSQAEIGLLRLEREPARLPDVLDVSLKSVQRSVHDKGQQLRLALPPDLPPLWADRLRVSQIFTNLLSNASKYTPAGGTIALSARRADDDMVEIVVRDTGIGMSHDDQYRVFERFFRSSDASVRQERGTGLGLNITRRLVEAHGGEIRFESALGEGTTFVIRLPSAQPHAAMASAAPYALSDIAAP